MSHYYNKKAEPCHKVKRSDGKGLRDTTVRDARKLKLYPSVTTIFGILNKIGLTDWQIERALKAVHQNPRQEVGEAWEDYVKRIIAKGEEIQKSESGRDKGSYYHSLLENFFKAGDTEQEPLSETDSAFILPIVHTVTDLIKQTTDSNAAATIEFFPELRFVFKAASGLAYAGTIDLVVLIRINESVHTLFIDFKSKNTTDLKKFKVYDEHLMQLAAYGHAFMANSGGYVWKQNQEVSCRHINLFFSSVEPGIIKTHEWTDEDVKKGTNMFFALLEYWQLKNNYYLESEDVHENSV